jgi:hypothetical protein
MENKSKLITGLNRAKNDGTQINYFTDAEKHLIIQEMLESGCTKRDIWEKYTGRKEEHGQILRWMRKLGYIDSIPNRKSNFVQNPTQMKKNNSTVEPTASFENIQLKKRIEELEKKLKDAEMRAIAYSTMIDLAEKEFKIPIKKKFYIKPSMK